MNLKFRFKKSNLQEGLCTQFYLHLDSDQNYTVSSVGVFSGSTFLRIIQVIGHNGTNKHL